MGLPRPSSGVKALDQTSAGIAPVTKNQLSRLVVKQQLAILVDKKDGDAQISGELFR
jgi:hypothetical protein